VRPGASAHRAARRRLLRLAQARRRLLHLRRASRCLGTSRSTSRSSLRCPSSTTPRRTGSSLTTWPTPRVRVPQHVERPSCRSSSTTSPRAVRTPRVRVPRHVAQLVVGYFAYAARPGASAHRAARRQLLRLAQAHRRLLRLRRASRCLGTSRGSSSTTPPRAGLSSTTSPMPHVWVPRHVARLVAPLIVDYFAYARVRVLRHVARLVMWLVVDYFAYVARSGASACCAAHRAAHHAAHRRPLRLRRASGCLGKLCGSLRHSSSTTSPTPCVRVPRHIARPVTRLIVDYFVRRDFVLRPHWLYFNHAVHHDYLSRGNTGSTSSTPRVAATSSSSRIESTTHLDLFSKLVKNGSHTPNN
jgi:hypothetical protein